MATVEKKTTKFIHSVFWKHEYGGFVCVLWFYFDTQYIYLLAEKIVEIQPKNIQISKETKCVGG